MPGVGAVPTHAHRYRSYLLTLESSWAYASPCERSPFKVVGGHGCEEMYALRKLQKLQNLEKKSLLVTLAPETNQTSSESTS